MSQDELEIHLQDTRPRVVPDRVPPDADQAFCVRLLGAPNPELMRVYVADSVLREVEGHAASFPDREAGGVLLGKCYSFQGQPYLVIENIVPGLKADGTATRLTFTHETWAQITAVKDRNFPELQIVGWYHTHPDLGIFLSRDDQYIHRNFFPERWQVAMVVDPINRDRGLFLWKNEALIRDDGLRLYARAADHQVLQQYLAALSSTSAEARAAEGRNAGGAQARVAVNLVFPEPSFTLPASWWRAMGIPDTRTAPRFSLKSLLLLLLAFMLFFLVLERRVMLDERETMLARQKQTQAQYQAILDRLPEEAKPGANDTGNPDAASSTIKDSQLDNGSTRDGKDGAAPEEKKPAGKAAKPGNQTWSRFVYWVKGLFKRHD